VTEASSLLLPRSNENPEFGSGCIFFVGNATLLIRYAGFTILTDPNIFHAGDHAHLGYGLTSTRRTNPAVEIEDLLPLDFILLSHLHGDTYESEVSAARQDLTPTRAASFSERDGCGPSDNLGCQRRLRSRTFRRMAVPES
jgi:L-ascorbate metabolism protein UlaG (beta-lactamase superfamily)